jgi:6-pyruvoyltetrahydropterin/6-carboxytetrahydropterin synthase
VPSCSRSFGFDYGHRVMNHESKCKHLHGHRGLAEVTVEAAALDSLGRVVDFGCIKDIVGGWIDENWDHGFLLHCNDMVTLRAFATFNSEHDFKQKVYLLPFNPTAENIAAYLGKKINAIMPEGEGLRCTHVKFYETPNCWSDWYDQSKG